MTATTVDCVRCAAPADTTLDGSPMCDACVLELEQEQQRVAATLPSQYRPSVEDNAGPAGTLTAPDWARVIRHGLTSPDTDAIPTPFPALTECLDGGLRPGELCLVCGYTGHGKSIYVDMAADTAAANGARVHIYMTEMTAYQRGLRLLARGSGVSFRHLKRRDLNPASWAMVDDALLELPYGCSIVSDWTIEQLVTHIRTQRWDLAVVDLIHGFHYRDERDLSKTSSALVRAAKGAEHQTAIIAAAHLNDAQMRDSRTPARPRPGLHSIKGSSSLKQDADVVLFVWQQDNEEGVPSGEGAVWVGKSRQSGLGAVSVSLNPVRMVFEADPA